MTKKNRDKKIPENTEESDLAEETTEPGKNKSLFFYTALIFIVAIVLIIIAIFGQQNMQKNQPANIETSVPQGVGISEKASALSDENKNLLDENSSLTKQLEEKGKESEKLKSEESNSLTLLDAYKTAAAGDKLKAKALISALDYDSLTDDQKTFYDDLNK